MTRHTSPDDREPAAREGRPRPGEADERTAAPRVPIEEIVTQATRAPSIQNTQPWAWRWDGDELLLRVDRTRHLRRADPVGRDMVISCGAALHHLQVAAAGLGWRAQVRRKPVTLGGRPVAAVTFAPAPASPVDQQLRRALEERRTDRRPMSDWSVPASRMEELAAEGRKWGVLVHAVEDKGTRARLAALAATAEAAQQDDRYYRAEESSLADAASGPEGSGMRPPPRIDPATDRMLVFATASDDVLSWLRTGEALSAVWLQAIHEGLALVPLSQGFEVDATRAALKDQVLDDRSCPQLVARVGWPPEGREPLPNTPRRPLREVLTQQTR